MDPLADCVAAFKAEHPDARAPDVRLDRDSDVWRLGFRALPNLTALWRRHKANWARRKITQPTNAVEDALEAAYWDFDALRNQRRGVMSERDAFKATLRKLIND